MRQLKLPDDVLSSPAAREILRVWVNGDGQGFALQVDVWDDPAAWGLLLVDLSRHVARAFGDKHGEDPAAVLARIREGFDVEWAASTDAPEEVS